MLDQQLDELVSVARAYKERHRRIEDLRWPGAARMVVNFTVDFDAMLLRRLMNEPPMQLAKGEFGGRVRIWRLISLVLEEFCRHVSGFPACGMRQEPKVLSIGAPNTPRRPTCVWNRAFGRIIQEA